MYPTLSILYYQCGYWSVWALFSAMFYHCIHQSDYLASYPKLLEIKKHFSWMMLSSASVGGFYISHYCPRRLYLPHVNVEFRHTSLVLCDILGHHIPWYLFTRKYILHETLHSGFTKRGLVRMDMPVHEPYTSYISYISSLLFSFLGCLYYRYIDWKTRYHLSTHDIFTIVVVFCLVHSFLFKNIVLKKKRFFL